MITGPTTRSVARGGAVCYAEASDDDADLDPGWTMIDAKHELTIRFGDFRGRYLCGPDALAAALARRGDRPAAALVDAAVWRRHRGILAPALADLPRRVRPAGEGIKTLSELEASYRWLARIGLPRDGLLIGIGGGTLLDMAALAASTWVRGVDFVSVPTTLLAAVDAAVGGKTAVNLDRLKNPIGTFHPAELVAADVGLMATLPRREWRNGLAETIKAAVIGSPALFRALESRADDLSAQLARGDGRRPLADAGALPWGEWIAASVKVKARVVASDPFEAGPRRALNLGHTLGHALEPLLGIGHGEAVALGMAVAARLAAARGLCTRRCADRQVALLAACGLPVAAAAPPRAEVGRLVVRDKKNRAGRVRWILPTRIGKVELDQPVDLDDALAALAG